MKKFFISMSLLIVLALPSTAFADNQEIVITEAEDGCYYETIIEEIPAEYNILNPNAKAATNTKTGRKTTYYKNAADDVLWYVRVTGTFTYGNGSSKCTSATVSAESKNKTWKIASKSSSKSGSKAKATATAKQYLNGATVGSVTKTVTLKCSSTGKLS